MEFEPESMTEALVAMAWQVLSTTNLQNPVFKQVVTDPVVLAELCAATPLSFCSGLFDATLADTPLDVSFFMNLPTDDGKRWGVYALVFDKPDVQDTVPLVYVGSGTESRTGTGIRSRLNSYNTTSSLPKYVHSALAQGYKIVHKGILVWSPMPSAGAVPQTRVLFLMIEAALAYWFWAFYSADNVPLEDRVHSLTHLTPWNLSSFSYFGLCGHNPLMESISADLDLTDDQREAIAVEWRQKRNVLSVNYRKYMMLVDPERRLALEREYSARYRLNHPEHKARIQQYVAANPDTVRETKIRSAAKIKDSKRFYCDLCGVSCSNSHQLKRHNKSGKHKIRVQKIESGVELEFRCDICNYSTDVKGSLTRHEKTKRHLAAMAKVDADVDAI